jgi:hypothetical protein
MQKSLSILLLLLICSFSFAQQMEDRELASLKNSLQVNNSPEKKLQLQLEICAWYREQRSPGRSVDSLEKYALLALENSRKLNKVAERIEAEIYQLFCLVIRRRNSEAELLARSLETKKMSREQKAFFNLYVGSMYSSRTESKQALHYFRSSAGLFEELGNYKWLGHSYNNILNELIRIQDFVSAIDFARKLSTALDLMAENPQANARPDPLKSGLYTVLAKLYEFAGDYETAKKLLTQQIEFGKQNNFFTNSYERLASVYSLEGKHDSSIIAIKQAIGLADPAMQFFQKRELAKYYLFNRQYKEALQVTTAFFDTLPAIQEKYPATRSLNPYFLLIHSAALAALGDKDEGAEHLSKAMMERRQQAHLPYMLDDYRLISEVMYVHGNFEQALDYKNRYQHIKDSLFGSKFLFMLDNAWRKAEMEKKQVQMALLENQLKLNEQLYKEQVYLKMQKDAELELLDIENQLKGKMLREDSLVKGQKEADIQQLKVVMAFKDEQLKKETLVRNLALAGILFFLFLGGTFYRNLALKRKNEHLQVEKTEQKLKMQQLRMQKADAEYRQQVARLEMQALRAQMNPHFIFNCLSSINWLIMEGNNEAASDYLNRFSRLIRMVLKNSGKTTISLADELSMLKLYLKMEGLRFDHSFQYEINHPEDLDLHGFSVPPLLLQPFCENAIWHGLLNKNGDRKLKINIAKHKEDLYCTITDNGIGRKLSRKTVPEKLSGHESMGLKLTSERLALFNEQENSKTLFEMEDLISDNGESAGTKVMIRIRSVNYKEKDINQGK